MDRMGVSPQENLSKTARHLSDTRSNHDPTEPSPTGKDSASNWNGNGELRPKIWTEPLEKQKGPERDMQKWRCLGTIPASLVGQMLNMSPIRSRSTWEKEFSEAKCFLKMLKKSKIWEKLSLKRKTTTITDGIQMSEISKPKREIASYLWRWLMLGLPLRETSSH